MGMTSNPSSRSDDDQMNHEIMVDQPLSTNSTLSIDSFDYNYYADEEYLSERRRNISTKWVDFQSYYSLPATPTASDDDAYYENPIVPVENDITTPSNGRRRRGRCRPGTATTISRSCGNTDEENETRGGDLVVITRPKGGRKPICMDLDEVKACRDLGFELEHDPRFFNTMPNFSATSNPGNYDTKISWKIYSWFIFN